MIEGLRRQALKTVFEMDTFARCWLVWRPEIARLTDELSNPEKIYSWTPAKTG